MPDAGVIFAASPYPVARFPPPVVAALVVVFTLGQGSSARAENDRETARLVYVVAANASGCPDEESFRNLVTARLGYDPFEPDGKHAAAVEITREAGRLRAWLLAAEELRRRGEARCKRPPG